MQRLGGRKLARAEKALATSQHAGHFGSLPKSESCLSEQMVTHALKHVTHALHPERI